MLELAAGHEREDEVAQRARAIVLPAGTSPEADLRSIAQVFVCLADVFQDVGVVRRKCNCRLYARNGLIAKLFLGIEQSQIGLCNSIARRVADRLFEQYNFMVPCSAFLFLVSEAFVGDRQITPYHVILIAQLQRFLSGRGGVAIFPLQVVEIAKVGISGVGGLHGDRFTKHPLGLRVTLRISGVRVDCAQVEIECGIVRRQIDGMPVLRGRLIKSLLIVKKAP